MVTPLLARIGRRGILVGAAYLATSLVALGVLWALNRHGDAALLRQVLAIYFITSLAAGLEPATAKAAALRVAPADKGPPSRSTIVQASVIKAFVASPVMAFVWRAADPTMDMRLLLFTPLMCIAGFAVTDLRVLFDLEGRHASAIWIKQGSLGGGLIILAALAGAGMSLPGAFAVATTTRLAFVFSLLRGGSPGRLRSGGVSVAFLLRDPRWMSLAGTSVIAAVGGSADRFFGLRFLNAEAWAGYFALYEVFSKFWFIPYVITPILFSRTAGGRDSHSLSRWAIVSTAASGALFVGVVAAVLAIMPSAPDTLLGTRLSAHIPSLAMVAFAGAVALNSLAQIRVAELQGRGAAHGVVIASGIGAMIAVVVFYVGARSFGAPGLLYAWLAKSIVELCLVYAPVWRD